MTSGTGVTVTVPVLTSRDAGSATDGTGIFLRPR